MPDAITLQGVTKTFGPKVAVDNVDLAIPEGSLLGLIGPNGAGKTTTIRMIMSIIFPDRGEISVLGRRSAVESKDRIGYLPEERGLYRQMRVGAFLAFMARLKGIHDAGLEPKIKQWLDRVGLADCYRKKAEELSKGMQQKVQFLAAIIHEPELVILDEPFSGLDPVNARLLRELIDEQHAAGRTIIFSTHQMVQAETLCDRIVMIHQGRKVLDNTPAEIRSRFNPRAVVFDTANGADADPVTHLSEVLSVRRVNGSFEAFLSEGVDTTAVIARIANAAPVTRVEVVRASLEDVFIEIVRSSIRTDAERELLRASLRDELPVSRRESGGD